MKAPPDLVFLHTSSGDGFVAAAHAGRLAVEMLGRRERRAVVTAIGVALTRVGAGPGTVRGLLVSNGPGSFTGIRVGLATAQGLAASRGLRVWICDSLEVEAAALLGRMEPLAVCHDARRGEVYAGLYDVRAERPRQLVAPFCATAEAAARRLRGEWSAGEALSVTGSGRALLAAAGGWREVPEPAPEHVATAAIRLAMEGVYEDHEPREVQPFYLRRPDVQQPRNRS